MGKSWNCVFEFCGNPDYQPESFKSRVDTEFWTSGLALIVGIVMRILYFIVYA